MLIVSPPYEKEFIIEMLKNNYVYKDGLQGEALEEIELLIKIENWETPDAFKNISFILYDATPEIFRGIVLFIVKNDFEKNIINDWTTGTIISIIKNNKKILSDFCSREFHVLIQWLGLITWKESNIFAHEPADLLKIYQNLTAAYIERNENPKTTYIQGEFVME